MSEYSQILNSKKPAVTGLYELAYVLGNKFCGCRKLVSQKWEPESNLRADVSYYFLCFRVKQRK